MRFALILPALFFPPLLAYSQIISRASVEKGGAVRLVERGGATKIIAPEPQQTGTEHLRIAPDARTVGWEVLIENCCTSYPIPIALKVYRDGKNVSFRPNGQSVWRWHFVGRGERIAILYGPVHGNPAGANLYDTRNGKLLEACDAPCRAPAWAKTWRDELQPQPRPANPPPRRPK